VVEPDGESTARRILWFSLALIPISLVPKFLSMTGNVYLVGAAAMGLLFLYAGLRISFNRTRQQARRVLLASVVYLPVLYGLMLFDHAA
jgi:protoheme IX farnesyltransferase